MNIPHLVQEAVIRLGVQAPNRIVVAVSGGADSVTLARAIRKSIPADRLIIAHLNHLLRGTDSDRDETFVAELAKELDCACEVERIDPRTQRVGNESLETIARVVRYDFLHRIADRHLARFVATGHTADDQVETILHHFLRGSGLRGLSGIPAQRPIRAGSPIQVIRPLLEVSRQELERWLVESGHAWRTDASNLSGEHTRNRIRNELLPLLRRDYQPELTSILRRLGAQCRDTADFLQRQAADLISRSVLHDQPNEVQLSIEILQTAAPVLAREMFVELWTRHHWPRGEMTWSHWDRLIRMVTEAGPAIDFPGGVRAGCRHGVVILSRRRPAEEGGASSDRPAM